MWGSLVFLILGTISLFLAAQGLLSGHVRELGRHASGYISQTGQPFVFFLTVTACLIFGLLFFALSVFMYWAGKKTKEAERRFFRQRALLEVKKD